MKLKWKVDPEPTGRYRSFEGRAWPSAEYVDGRLAAFIVCSEDYRPRYVKTGNHPELAVKLYDYSGAERVTKVLKARFATLAEAKAATAACLAANPQFGGSNK